MRTTLIPFVAGVCLASLCVTASVPEEVDLGFDSGLEFDEAAFERHVAPIKTEIAEGSEADWAGEYDFGDGLGVNVSLAIAPKSGFAFVWSGCLGVYGSNRGSVEIQNGRLVLGHVRPNRPGSFGGFSNALVPVSWGDRLYLIGEEQLDEFVNAVNAGVEPCRGMCGRFLLRTGDSQAPVSGRPALPDAYAAKLIDAPLRARVTKILERDQGVVDDEIRRREATVELDIGRAHGAWKGLELHSTAKDSRGETYTLTQIAERSSLAQVVDFSSVPLLPRLGQCLSTRFADDAVRSCASD